VFAALVHAPDGSGVKLAAMIVFHRGDPEAAERDLAPFKDLGLAAHDPRRRHAYPVMNTLLDENYPTGSLNYWLSSFTRGFRALIERWSTLQIGAVTNDRDPVEHFHGAVTRVGATETAVPHRAEGWNLLLPRLA